MVRSSHRRATILSTSPCPDLPDTSPPTGKTSWWSRDDARIATALGGGPEVLRIRTVELGQPGPGEMTVAVRAAGMNPIDYKRFERGQEPSVVPLRVDDELARVRTAIGPDTRLASGDGSLTAALFLASSDSSFITGANLVVDGGFSQI
jgi:NAD(P)-dependent dehydrogenase (short-subunit alcohol dehydrogenase family)